MNPKLKINANQIHAERMLHVTKVYVPAYLTMLVIHTVDAIQSVFWIVNVHATKLASGINVLIHVLECAVAKQSVPLPIISQCVIVYLVTPEMLTSLVLRLKVRCNSKSSALLWNIDLILMNIRIFLGPQIAHDDVDRCYPSPCGQNSHCMSVNNQAICSCLLGYFGAPPACRRECAINSDCVNSKACVNERCIDPCPGSCGYDAECRAVNHKALCYCMPRYTGDPFVRCSPVVIGKDKNHLLTLSGFCIKIQKKFQ